MSVALIAFIPTIAKISRAHKFKRFGLVIMLKDGSVFRKQVPKNFKSDTVELINEVKRKRLNCNNWTLVFA